MIIGFCGKLQSGKSSSCRYLVGEIMKKNGYFKNFKMGEDGSLIIPDSNGNFGVFDPEGLFVEDLSFYKNLLWKHVKIINFADSLKMDCCKYFNIPKELAYGSNKDKDTKLNIKWKDIQHVFAPTLEFNKTKLNSKMTVRDVLITYADMVRSINPEAFVNSFMSEVKNYPNSVILAGDVRYEYEAKTIQENRGKVIRFSKVLDSENKHSSEQSDLIDPKYIDVEIDNSQLSMIEKNKLVKKAAIQWGIL